MGTSGWITLQRPFDVLDISQSRAYSVEASSHCVGVSADFQSLNLPQAISERTASICSISVDRFGFGQVPSGLQHRDADHVVLNGAH